MGPSTPETPEQRNLFASTVHGLEHITAAELTELGCRVVSVQKRQVLLTAPELCSADRPRTVDDLLIQIAQTVDPGPTKADLQRLRPLLDAADLKPAKSDFERGDPVLTVSASMIGRRTYNRHDLEDVIGSFLSERLGARFASRSGGNRPPVGAAEWRAVLSPEGLLLGYRGRRPPLHRRAWKTASIPGTLHPPVAAATARLAGIETGMTVLDPCCGAGTILVEARGLAPSSDFIGSDLNAEALAAAARNAQHLTGIAFTKSNAARLPMPTGSIDRIVTNPAWGRQVATVQRFPALLAAWRRVIAADGRLVCLVPPELLRDFETERSAWNLVERHQLSLSGQHPVIALAEPKRR
ncbi:RNA methyltransferase [Glycomyces sp. TRM65418]|uniref:methyltransferase domain-containing protein n=1 Tax=Glycomyces sp. TRM65418 TaxID=2867006 RepID=UPI001CE62B06|nr:methyltransferase domain-containing protein [Glycomyces sp. TRM65418]MCC3764469.1 RNA methyltransferase [Glycomyces sp. TRM65418]QZD54142.1 RNA methyltransferase [Glycomyces sp. TRM65418]